MTRSKRNGSATVEMTLIGIPIIFTLISIFEMSRGMWMYQTLAYSVKAGVRFAIVHGASCDYSLNNGINSCIVGVADVAATIENAGVGLDPQNTLLTFIPPITGATGCPINPNLNPPPCTSCYLGSSSATPASGTFGSYVGCGSLTIPANPNVTPPANQWPPEGANKNGNEVSQPIEIDIRTPFRSAIAMFWPESKSVSFTEARIGATSTDDIQF